MSGFKGTKGKWLMEWNGYYHEIKPDSNDYYQKVAGFSTCLHDMSHGGAIIINGNEEDKANALLISKAPEMLDQLNRIHGEIMRSDGVLDVEKWGNQIEQLIKSATEL